MTSVLIVLSGAKVWTMKDGTPHSTGFWSLEFTTAHQKFTAAGLEVHIATPGGVTPTVDPLSGSHLLRERPRAVTAETRAAH